MTQVPKKEPWITLARCKVILDGIFDTQSVILESVDNRRWRLGVVSNDPHDGIATEVRWTAHKPDVVTVYDPASRKLEDWDNETNLILHLAGIAEHITTNHRLPVQPARVRDILWMALDLQPADVTVQWEHPRYTFVGGEPKTGRARVNLLRHPLESQQIGDITFDAPLKTLDCALVYCEADLVYYLSKWTAQAA